MEIDVILFDWGGTLASVVRQIELFRKGAREAGVIAGDGVTEADLDRLIAAVLAAEDEAARDLALREADLVDIVTGWTRSLDGRARPDRIPEALAKLGEAWIGSLEPFAGAADALRTLRGRGKRMGLVSNCILPGGYASREAARHGLAPYLDFLLFSSDVGYRKPSPVIYEAALSRAFPGGQPADLSRVMFVGDSPAFDVIAPAALGMKTALVRREPGAWPAEDYARARPDFTVDGVMELPNLIE